MLAHIPLDPGELWASFAQFGSDWLHVGVPVAVAAGVALGLALLGRGGPGRGPVVRVADGAARVTGLPAWVAGPLTVLVGWSLPMAAAGFFWDVAWHIDIGRDEFLLSPPHVFLLLGVGSFWVAGAMAIHLATRLAADTRWRVEGWRLPFGGVALLVAGVVAVAGWGIDELWHAAYGLDVTMWSPPHLMMILPAVLAPMAAWLLWAEAGRQRGTRTTRRILGPLLAGILLTSTSAMQLEFDLGVPQWQGLYQPVLIALAAGFTLVAARAALGRGGALLAVAVFLVVRSTTTLLTTEVWGLSQPRFPLYLGAAVTVEVLTWLRERRGAPEPATRHGRDALLGLGVGTVGLVTAGLWTQVWAHHPWDTGMLPMVGVATLGAVGAALLGGPFGRVVAGRPAAARPAGLVAGGALIAVAALAVLPRVTPDAEATVRAEPVADGRALITVEVDEGLIDRPQRWEIMSWQGDGSEIAPLHEVEPGVWRPEGPVPADGSWKSMVRFNDGPLLGALPVYAPEDPEIGAPEIPLLEVREQVFVDETGILLREAHDGPAWPGVVAYTALYTGIAAIVVLLVAGTVALDRRRRAEPESAERAPVRDDVEVVEAAAATGASDPGGAHCA